MKKIFAVLPVCNEADTLPGCLDNLAAIGVDGIVAVENGSTDDTPKILDDRFHDRRLNLTTLTVPFTNLAAIWTDGITAAQALGADWVLCLGADERYGPAMKRLLSVLRGDTQPHLRGVRMQMAVLLDEDYYSNLGDDHCNLHRSDVRLQREVHPMPIEPGGRNLHCCNDSDILRCWENPDWTDVVTLHLQLCRSDEVLEAKGRLWAERGLLAQSAREGVPITGDFWLVAKKMAATQRFPIPAGWKWIC